MTMPQLAVRYNETFLDRFLIIDAKELYQIGVSAARSLTRTGLMAGSISTTHRSRLR